MMRVDAGELPKRQVDEGNAKPKQLPDQWPNRRAAGGARLGFDERQSGRGTREPQGVPNGEFCRRHPRAMYGVRVLRIYGFFRIFCGNLAPVPSAQRPKNWMITKRAPSRFGAAKCSKTALHREQFEVVTNTTEAP